jgi:uncharacterized membrane protein YbhN (UPF0104 family)
MSKQARARAVATRAVLVLLVMAGGLWLSTTGIAGVHWHDVFSVLASVTLANLVVLAIIWAAGLLIYSVVLATSLPGLGAHRGLLLNLSGSAVANVLPLGGALATALNWKMIRRWGHPDSAFVAYTLLTNALDVLAKMLLPFVAVAALLLWSMHVPTLLWVATVVCAVVLVGAAGVRLWLMRPGRAQEDDETDSAPPGERIPGRLLHGLVRKVQPVVRESGSRIGGLLRDGWPRLLPASVGYVVAQVVLFGYALSAVGLEVSVAAVVAAAAIERLGTVLPITPGATGIAEIGTIAFLIATGLDPASVVAGVLLYRLFIVLIEIPVGGTLLGGWMVHQRMLASRRAAA